jgi:hypothetical protein
MEDSTSGEEGKACQQPVIRGFTPLPSHECKRQVEARKLQNESKIYWLKKWNESICRLD